MTQVNTISEVGIVNMALSRGGSTQTISSFGDGSNEANQAIVWYAQSRDAVLTDFPWPWARGYAALAEIAGPDINGQVANAEYVRSYRYPPDCLNIKFLLPAPQANGSGTSYSPADLDRWWLKPDGRPYAIPYTLSQDATGRLILTDYVGNGYGLVCIYTRAVADPSQFSPDFADALAWRLAIDLSWGLSFSGEKRQACERMYETFARRTRARAMNEVQGVNNHANRYRAEGIRRRWVM